MRTAEEMLALFAHLAKSDERIRAMTLEGSRVYPNLTPDPWQDYDITFLVTAPESFQQSDDWLSVFGDRVFLQKPEAMTLFAPDLPPGWFSYLMLFSDGVKIDLTLVPVTQVSAYFAQDPLIQVLLDKDGICPPSSPPSDEPFWIQKPSAAFVEDCANEFFMTSTYVAKGLLRHELLYANHLFEQILRVELNRMLGYLAGVRNGFAVNTGKYNKWLPQFLTASERTRLFETYHLATLQQGWNALSAAMQLFEAAKKEVCAALSYENHNEEKTVKAYIETLKALR